MINNGNVNVIQHAFELRTFVQCRTVLIRPFYFVIKYDWDFDRQRSPGRFSLSLRNSGAVRVRRNRTRSTTSAYKTNITERVPVRASDRQGGFLSYTFVVVYIKQRLPNRSSLVFVYVKLWRRATDSASAFVLHYLTPLRADDAHNADDNHVVNKEIIIYICIYNARFST